jgi:hypothetical protein
MLSTASGRKLQILLYGNRRFRPPKTASSDEPGAPDPQRFREIEVDLINPGEYEGESSGGLGSQTCY